MTKSSETRKINSKKKNWDRILRQFGRKWNKLWSSVSSEINHDTKSMIKFLFFFPLDNGRIDWLHVIEVIAVDVLILFAFSRPIMSLLEAWGR